MKMLVFKAIVYRCIILVTQFLFFYIVTGDVIFSSSTSVILGILATIEYMIMEHYWDRFVCICKKYFKLNGETI